MAGAGVTFETVSTAEDFETLGPAGWDELVRAMRRPSPFMLHGWLSEWWRHYGEGAELAVHVARRDDRLVAGLPFFIRPSGGVRVAEFLGAAYSNFADLLLAPDADESTARQLADRAATGGQDLAELHGLDAASNLAGVLGPARLRLVERVEAPVLDLSAGWDTVYREKTHSKKRNSDKRRRRQLAEEGTVEVTVARSADELERELDDAFRLHELRWTGRYDGSGFATEVGKRFHRAAIRRLAEVDAARIVTLRLDGRAIAFHYYFALCGRMFVHRLAFDPALGRFSPGLLNTHDALAAASEEGLVYVEFMGSADRYKTELADRNDPMHDAYGMVGSLKGRAVAAAKLHLLLLRRRLKRSEPLQRAYLRALAAAQRVRTGS